MSHGGGTLLLQPQNSTKPPGVVSRGWFPGMVSRGGFPGVVSRGWFPGGGFPGVVSRGWFPGGGFPGVVSRGGFPGWFPGVVSRGGFPGRITMYCSYMRSCRLVHLLYLYNDETCRLVVQISSNLTIYRHPASLVLYRQMKHCSNQLADGFEIQLS